MRHSNQIVSLFTNAPDGALSDWEMQFVASNYNRVMVTEDETGFSEKQQAIIEKMFSRVFPGRIDSLPEACAVREPEQKKKPAMQLTPEQKAIVHCDLHGHETLKIIAFAGTGKTTVLNEYTKARPQLRFLYVAFNKSVQSEAESKFPGNVNCRTAHSLAWQLFGSKYRHKLEFSLKANIVMKTLGLDSYEDAQFALDTLLEYLVSADEQISRIHASALPGQFHSQKKGEVPDFVSMAKKLWGMMCDEQNDEIGMLHDGYLKLYQLSKPCLDFDCILLDEAQDTNPVTANIVLSQPCPKILVGDPHQQIYSFRGARDAMQEITATSTMYLTHSFRFGSNIAELANKILHCFKDETHSLIGTRDKSEIGVPSGNYAIIARTNATIFSEAVRFYRQRKIGFVGGVEGYRFNDIVDTYHLSNNQKDKIKNNYIRSFKSYYDLKDFAKTVEDWELSSRCTVVDEYRHQIPALVRDIQNAAVDLKDAEIVLTTAHKSKGMEFKEVHLADDFPELVNDGELINREELHADEINLIYVSITRAQERIMLSKSLEEFTKQYSDSNEPGVLMKLLEMIPEEWRDNAAAEADSILKTAGDRELKGCIGKINQIIKKGVKINSYGGYLRRCHNEKWVKNKIPRDIEQALLKAQHEALDRLQVENPDRYSQLEQQAADALGLNLKKPGAGGKMKIKFEIFKLMGND
ncbi:MAG: ATP-dependent helicase [Desulfamplus sp.]|nr:ATP-dependent helicase [Desulfamplus sp.]